MSQTETQTPAPKRAPGRPIVEGSKRQLELAAKESRRVNGEIKKGRPVSTDSKAAAKRELAAKKAALGVNKPGFNKAKLLKMGIDPITFDVIGTTPSPVVETADAYVEEAVTE